MKKTLCILVGVLFCFIVVYSLYENISNNKSEQMEVLDSGKYYRIYKGSTNQIRYDIYNYGGEIVLSEETEHPLEIRTINGNIIDIEIGMGTGITIHKYYDVDENVFSQEFQYVLSNLEQLIAYVDVPKANPLENRKVIVRNIFDKQLFYKEYELDFSYVDTPVIEAKFSRDGAALHLTYLSGEQKTQVSTVLELSQ